MRRIRGWDSKGVLAMVLLGAVLSATAGCTKPEAPGYQGYAEGEFVLVASPFAGQLVRLHVHRGQQVDAGSPLFELEQDSERANQREASARVDTARAEAENLSAMRRPLEREAALAAVEEARAALELSTRELARLERLFAKGFVSEAAVDSIRSRHERDRATLAQAHAQAALSAQSVGRRQEVSAARATIDAARATLSQREWAVAQKSPQAPVSGLVYDTFFVPGEWVPAGRPVASLLPPGNIKLRFYVPEPEVGSIHVGQRIAATCDGCGAAIPGAIAYVSPQPEYTPPVIYSRQERAKLVFLVEARPDAGQAQRLKPGQPLDVRVRP
jgi:HlyD family secretion protein